MARKAAKAGGEAAKPGRPTSFTPVLAERVCAKVMEGMGLERVGALKGFPATKTMYRWLGKEGPEYDVFRQNYARACEVRAGARFKKLREWGERAAEGKMDPAAARAAADIEKWCLAREAPRKYGDAMTLRGDKDNPLRVTKTIDLSDDDLLATAAGDRFDG